MKGANRFFRLAMALLIFFFFCVALWVWAFYLRYKIHFG
ncbi:hypothetical protein CfE428DRAFT_2388 [Chthoniobacter flavus Ellin428]|uniref:Uncharacterized protein n=1 Tax=Chthoniobacter flavus Ellin428 TaxID=497964 RepID=B4D0D7_9BACT|nr:hypothetical protein CfE428DRAFT_2388 [Chthoniobacter flavus Ellin428]TCO91927.1 hypothetical protein EV701_107208 [Chthoniobacter flavus]